MEVVAAGCWHCSEQELTNGSKLIIHVLVPLMNEVAFLNFLIFSVLLLRVGSSWKGSQPSQVAV